MSDIYENIFLPLHEARGTRANEVAGGGGHIVNQG